MRIDTFAAATGIAGGFLMALLVNPALAFGLFTASNVSWLVFSRRERLKPLFAQQLLFLVASLLGLWNAWLGPLLLG